MTMLRWGGWILLVCLTAPTAAQVINDNYFCRQKHLTPNSRTWARSAR